MNNEQVTGNEPSFTTLDEFLEEEGIKDEVEKAVAERLDLNWILCAVDRLGEAFVVDASPGFWNVDLLPEHWACDNGIEVPKDLTAGLYRLTDVSVRGSDDWVDIKAKWEKLA